MSGAENLGQSVPTLSAFPFFSFEPFPPRDASGDPSKVASREGDLTVF